MIIHTAAIILKTIDYGETSKIVTIFSKKHGKMAVIAHSAKKPKSKFSGLLEPCNVLDVVYYYKKSRSVQILSEASYIEKTMELKLNFEKMATAMSALELISQLLHEHEVNDPFFNFTQQFLLWLNETNIEPALVFPYLQLRLCNLMGLGLQLQIPNETADKINCYLNIDAGTINAKSVSPKSYKLTKNQFRYIVSTLQSRNSSVFNIAFENGELKELVTYLDRYLYFHVDGLSSRKSDAIFEQILKA